jgi:ABC-type glycerol-3-phosphate transport system substrate-binding protein
MSKKLLNVLLVIVMLAVLVPTALAAPPAQEGQDYVVVADDWLSKLADKYLGNPMAYPAIVEYTNQKHAEDASYAEITNPDLIEVGWKVYIPSAEEAAALAPAPPPAVVTLVYSNWHLAEPHWEKTIKAAIPLFEQEYPNIKVELQVVSYAEKEAKYATEIEAGTGPDLMHLAGYSIRNFVESGYLLDITPFIEKEPAGFLDQWYPHLVDLFKYQDKQYGLPSDYMSQILAYDKKLFTEAGLDPNKPPTTWDEFLDYAKKLTRDRDGDGQIDTWGFGTVGAVDPGWELRFSPVLLSHGAAYLTPDNKCSALNSPEAKEAFKFWVGLVTDAKVVPPGVTSQGAGAVRVQFANEQVAMEIASGWDEPIIPTINADFNVQENLGAAPMPVKAGTTLAKTTTAWYSGWMINRNTKYPEQAWTLLKWLTSKESDQRWFDGARVLSSRRDVSGDPDKGLEPYQPIADDKFSQVISAELKHAQINPQLKEWPQIADTVNKEVQNAYTGSKSAEAALKDAYDQINQILAPYRTAGETCPAF